MNDQQKRDQEKQAALDRILKDDTRGLRILPAPGYGHKMQTIRSNKVTV